MTCFLITFVQLWHLFLFVYAMQHPEYQQQRSAMMVIERPLGRNLTGHVCGEDSIATEIASGNSNWVVSKLDDNWQGGSAWIIENPGSEHSQHPE